MLIKKIPDKSGLVTTTALNTKISEDENKIQNITFLVSTTVFNTKIREVEKNFPINLNVLLLNNLIS